MSAPFHRLPPFWDEQAEQMPVSATATASRPFLVLNFRASCTRPPISSARIPGKNGSWATGGALSTAGSLTIDIHLVKRHFALDPISAAYSAPASAFRGSLACFRYIGRASDTSSFWLCCNSANMTGKSCRMLLDLLAKKGAFSPQP
jgi:hypothetical protein